MKSVAIVYHYFAHYRQPILQELNKSEKINFTFISGEESEIAIKKIDPSLAVKIEGKVSLNWLFVKNFWFRKKFLWQSGLTKILCKNSYETVIFLGNPYFFSTWLAILICKLKKVKVYFWMHGFYKDKMTTVDYIKLYVFYKMADGLFLYGNRAFNIMLHLNIKKAGEMCVVYNSLNYDQGIILRKKLDLKNIHQFRESHFQNSDLPTICFIGRINKIKRIEFLIEVQKQYIKEHKKPMFNALIIGDGEELANLRNQVLNELPLDVETFKFTGSIYNEDEIANLIMYSDVCVTPGEIGLTAMHSMTYGTPVISHDNLNIQMPEVEAIYPGLTGDLYKYNDVNSLLQTMKRWLENYPVKTQRIVHNCYDVIDQNYNPHIQKSIFEEELLKC